MVISCWCHCRGKSMKSCGHIYPSKNWCVKRIKLLDKCLSHWRKLILAFVFFWRVLEASLAENKSGLKRKRGDPWVRFVDPVNPYERQRLDGCPVGLKNVGNTCWFSAVIQVCISVTTDMLTTWRLISVIILVHF